MQVKSKALNVGIIGKGSFSGEIVDRFIRKGHFGMCSGFHAHAHQDIIRLRSFEELEHASDAVLIFDPAYSDFKILGGILRLSKHVYLEHHGLLSLSDIRELSSLAREAGSVFQIGLKHRFNELNTELMGLQIRPRIIESNRYTVYREHGVHLSLIEDLLVPDIDMTIQLTGSQLKSVYATGVGVLYKDPDVVNARLEFYNGCVANFSASKIAQKEVHKIRLFQNNSFYDVNYLTNSLRILKGDEAESDEEVTQNEDSSDETKLYQKTVNPLEILEKELDSFYYCIMFGTETVAGPDHILGIRDATDRIFDQLERNFRSK